MGSDQVEAIGLRTFSVGRFTRFEPDIMKFMKEKMKIGIIGLDTSYVEIYASLLTVIVACLNRSLAQ